MMVAFAAAAAMAHGAMPAGAAVSIAYAAFTPRTVEVVAGEPVTWTNDSVRQHTVTAQDASFDSGVLPTGDTYEREFAALGRVDYYCRLHAGIVGAVEVRGVVLDQQREAAARGRPFPLTGRTTPGVRTVTVTGDDGSSTAAAVAPDGTFTASVTPRETTTYGAGDSAPVTLRVLDRTVTTHALARPGHRWSVIATVSPASPGATVVLQLRLRERFGWWPVAAGRLGRDSATTLRVHRSRRTRARVVLTLPDRATPLAVSRSFRLGAGQ
jgi:plastocyanin